MSEGERQKARQIKQQATTIKRLKQNQLVLLNAIDTTRARPGHYGGCTNPRTPCPEGCKIIREAIAYVTSP